MKFGICTSFREVAQLKEIPFDYLEENVQNFLLPERPQAEFEEQWQLARNLPIPIEAANILLSGTLSLIATPDHPVDTQRLERSITTTLQRAEQVGIRVIVFGSGKARAYPHGMEKTEAQQQIAAHLAHWSELGKQHGVTFALEPLRYEETNTINTIQEGGELVTSIASSGAALLADLYHMACNQETPEDLASWVPLLQHVHVAEHEGRTAPGIHGDDFRPYFAVLRQRGYDQRISIECRWGDFASEVGPAIALLRQQWETCV